MDNPAPRAQLPGASPEEHPLIPVRIAARMLGYSEMTIRRRIGARKFPAVKIGRKSMIPRSFVERLLADAEAGRTVILEESLPGASIVAPSASPAVLP